MKQVTSDHWMTIVGLVWGFVVFHVIRIFETPPYWISLASGSAVFLLCFFARDLRRRSIACEGDELVITDGNKEIRIPKGEIRCFRITRITSLRVRITMHDQDEISFLVGGFFSEEKIVMIFEKLGIKKG